MYPAGITLLDLTDEEANTNLTMSHVAARAEVRALVSALNCPASRSDGISCSGSCQPAALLLVVSLAARLSAHHLRLLALVTLFVILGGDLSCWRWPGVMGLPRRWALS